MNSSFQIHQETYCS